MFIYPDFEKASLHVRGTFPFLPGCILCRVLRLKRSIITQMAEAAEVFPKFLVEKYTEERVDAAVGGSDDFQHMNTSVQVVVALAVMQGEVFFESRQEKCDIVGSPH